MRPSSIVVAAIAGLSILYIGSSRTDAMTTTSPAGLRLAAEVLDPTESVHCRRYFHRHRHGHRWSRGCRVGVVIEGPRRSGVVVREGVRVRSGVSIRSRTTIRSRTGTTESGATIRSRSGAEGTVGTSGSSAPAKGQSKPAPAAKPGGPQAPASPQGGQ